MSTYSFDMEFICWQDNDDIDTAVDGTTSST